MDLYKLKQDFLDFWTEEKVRSMSLEEYTNLGKENSFCYWLESKTTDLGSIWGGSSYKFGIYERNDTRKTVEGHRGTDGKYAWYLKYGDTKKEAFNSIKNNILDIIEYVKKKRFNKIEEVDLGAAYKWKIAFLYSDFDILNIFKYDVLLLLAKNKGYDTSRKTSTYQLQSFLMENKPADTDYFEYSHNLWKEYKEGDVNSKFEDKYYKRKERFINWLQSQNLSIDIADELELLSNDVLSKGHFKKFIYDCYEYYDIYQLQFEEPISYNWEKCYEYYFDFSVDALNEDTGIDLHRNYGIVTVENNAQYDYFINNNIWQGDNRTRYDSYVRSFMPGSRLAIYKWEGNNIKIGAIGTVTYNPGTGYDLGVSWNKNLPKFVVTINSTPGSLAFYQIEPGPRKKNLQDIVNIFYNPLLQTKKNKDKMPLNQIYYGAPGTGKTYTTKKAAVEIIDSRTYSDSERALIVSQYNKYIKTGQINFVTFHQSMSYEDFIEGIKPSVPDEAEEGTPATIEYEVKDGIFKRMAKSASSMQLLPAEQTKLDYSKVDFYKMSLGGKHRLEKHNWSIDNNVIFLGWGRDKDFTGLKGIKEWTKFKEAFTENYPELVSESKFSIQAVYIFLNMKIGDIVIVSKGNKIIDAIGVVTSEYYYDDNKEIDNYQFRDVKWLATNMNFNSDVLVSKAISQMTIYKFLKEDINISIIEELLNNKQEVSKSKKYVLIIDEINRGNISSIFGELITLIEEDKRAAILQDRPEALEVELPYSNDKFSVPDNLYIIGTMNTADRSVEALDTALRRRFSFVEMQPDPIKLLQNNGGVITDAEGEINLVTLLTTINNRIEILIDKDHQIGHSFFINVKTVDELKEVFKNKVIPLLEEYFFGDYGKIGLVLGKNFIQPKSYNGKDKFAEFPYGEGIDVSVFTDKVVYEFASTESWNTKAFCSIYE